MHYKFIDIGCGHTNVSVDVYGLLVRGLLVDPIKEFCDVLPSSSTVLVECSAITDYDGDVCINITSEDMSGIAYLPITALDSLTHIERITKKFKIFGAESIAVKRDMLTSTRTVRCLRLDTLLNKYNIDSVDQFKIDAEGCEYMILQQLIDLMRTGKLKVNERIIFEYNDLSTKTELDELTQIIANEFGFTYEFKKVGWNEDIIMTKLQSSI